MPYATIKDNPRLFLLGLKEGDTVFVHPTKRPPEGASVDGRWVMLLGSDIGHWMALRDLILHPESMKLSRGHVTIIGDFEYFHGPDQTLYRGPLRNPLDLDGYRQGGRFECAPRKDDHRSYLQQLRQA